MKLWQGCITDLHCFPLETDGKIQTQTSSLCCSLNGTCLQIIYCQSQLKRDENRRHLTIPICNPGYIENSSMITSQAIAYNCIQETEEQSKPLSKIC